MDIRLRMLACLLAVNVFLIDQASGQERERGRQASQIIGAFKAADANAITITQAVEGRRGRGAPEAAPAEKTFALANNVEVVVATSRGSNAGRGAGALFKEVKLADLAAGVKVNLTLAADDKSVECVVAEGPTVRGLLKAVDPTKNAITVSLPPQGARGRGEAPAAAEDKSYTVAPDAEIALDDGRGSRFAVKEGKLGDLVPGALVMVHLSVDLKQVQGLLAEGATHQGTIKALDAGKKTLTLTVRPPRGDDAGEEQSLLVATDAMIFVDDGKGRRLSLREAKFADVPVGAAASVKLSADQNFVMQIRVEGPTVTGMLKSVDADKHIIVIAIPKGRNDADEQTLTVAKDARVAIDGAESTLANLKVGDNGPMVQLRLSLDQKTVQAVSAHQARSR